MGSKPPPLIESGGGETLPVDLRLSNPGPALGGGTNVCLAHAFTTAGA